jgi:glycosyltransferase involved in cell wall biosynthesis
LPSPKQRVIYYCVDDWTQFHNLDGEYLGRKERQLVTRADTIFAASRFLADKLQQTVTSSSSGSRIADPASAPKVHYMPHGVEHAKFAAALTPETATPVDVSRIPHPIIGFYGNLHSWVDVRLIADLAAACQDWQFVLIGHPYDDVSPVESLPNVHLLGRREHDELPAYCRAFDVAVIPYDMSSNRMESVNPVKTKELLAAGLPVVASAVPELAGMEPDVVIARSVAEWLSAIEAQLSREDRQAISRRVKQEDWVEKVTEIRGLVDRAGWREQP